MRQFHSQRIQERSWIFLFTGRAVKYFLLALLSFVIVCVVTPMLGIFGIIAPFVDPILEWFGRVAVLIACLMVISVVVESLRQ